MYDGDEIDEDESLGRQVLPVADLPDDFDGNPEDGMQYLFMVRRDARRLPTITRSHNPYEVVEPPRSETVESKNASQDSSTSQHLPTEEWRNAFVERFKNLRQNVNQPTIHVSIPSKSPTMPPTLDRNLWWAFIHGRPESEWNPKQRSKRQQKRMMERETHVPPSKKRKLEQLPTPEPDSLLEEGELETERIVYNEEGEQVPQDAEATSIASTPPGSPVRPTAEPFQAPKEPVPATPTPPAPCISHIRKLGSHSSIYLLRSFVFWLNHRTPNATGTFYPLSPTLPQWIWALLVALEHHLNGDELHVLREVARAAMDVIRSSIVEGAPPSRQAPWWMIVIVVANVWGQKDLWFDAESMVQKIRSQMLSA